MDLSHLQQHQARVNDFLSCQLADMTINDPRLHQAMNYGLLLGGKRIRPYLVYETGQMLGVDLSKLDHCAGAIEAIHAYSLIHDDLPAMDDDDLRRGQATCHIKFDQATAILAGDALQTFSYELLCQADLESSLKIDLVKVLANSSGYHGMCGGQALDLAATNQHVSLEQLQQIHHHKTGALIHAAVEMAAICAGINQAERELLKKFSAAIGLAFQVHDDILDIIGDTQTLGKPQGSDIEANKCTYPALMGLEQAQLKAQQLIDDALHALDALPYNSEQLKDFSRFIIARNQ
ncbi:MAG: (2E,6E)-farnesyl diphosphate synthase [Gammaproteobacteria bacterium]|nr:(2E,6E)-farnesyl diphosphate synthase [Gammaproteobacteria bacterium]